MWVGELLGKYENDEMDIIETPLIIFLFDCS